MLLTHRLRPTSRLCLPQKNISGMVDKTICWPTHVEEPLHCRVRVRPIARASQHRFLPCSSRFWPTMCTRISASRRLRCTSTRSWLWPSPRALASARREWQSKSPSKNHPRMVTPACDNAVRGAIRRLSSSEVRA